MSIQIKSKYDRNQAYHYYYDLDVLNNNVSGNQQAVVFKFLETRNQPYLYCPENYFMSVVRFTLQTPSLPVFIPTVLLGQSDPNKLVYAVTLEYNYTSPVGSNVPNFSGSFTQNLIFVSPDKTQPTPAPPLVSQDFSSTYYYLYSYTQWVAMINTAFAIAFGDGSTTTTAGLTGLFNAWKTTNNTAITAWNATHTGATSIPTQLLISYPLMEFNPTSLTNIINVPFPYYDAAYQTKNNLASVGNFGIANVYFNAPLYNLYNNFQWTKTAANQFQLFVDDFNAFNIFTNTNAATVIKYVQCFQEGSTISLLNPVSSVVFTSSLLPIVQDIVSVPVSNNASGVQSRNGGSNLTPVITDFQVAITALNTYRPDLQYTPNGEYRLIDLVGTSPLSSIEVSVFWKDFYGNLNPFYLAPGCSANIKIMFRRKDYNNPDPVY